MASWWIVVVGYAVVGIIVGKYGDFIAPFFDWYDADDERWGVALFWPVFVIAGLVFWLFYGLSLAVEGIGAFMRGKS